LNNLGVAAHEGGDSARALDAYGKSLAALKRTMSAASPQAVSMLQLQLPTVAANLGLAQWQRGDLAGATDSWRLALDERAIYEFKAEAFMTERSKLAKAQALAVELHALVTLERSAAASGAGQVPRQALALQTLLERKGALLESQTRVQTAFRRDATAQGNEPGALGGLFESPSERMQRQSASRRRGDDQELLREYEAATRERAELARTPANAARSADLDNRIQVMQQRMQMHEQGQLARAERPDYGQILRESRNDPQRAMAAINAADKKQEEDRRQREREARSSLFSRVQQRLPQGAVLVEMLKYRPLDPRAGLPEEKRWAAERYGAYVIRAAGEAEFVDFGEAAPLDKLVQAFRAALSDQTLGAGSERSGRNLSAQAAAVVNAASNPERDSARELGRKLDELLMRPVRARLGGARILYVAPEGSLNLAPLSALVDEEGRYLVERYTFNYLASGRDLLSLGRGETSRAPAMIFADPAFDERVAEAAAAADAPQRRSRDFRSARFDRLPGTAAEAQTLKRVLPDAAVLTGSAATETAAKGIHGPRILHIATHGFFLEDAAADAEDPMLRSGLVFAGVNASGSGQDDGVLTALEASGLDLRGTRLVVLSACETGLGEVKNGEGVFGLRRAFVVAGAETLLMSLWQVADDATKDLMVSYYARLARGESRADALRDAQLAMLKDPRTAHPFFWAAFISSGESGPLK
jgi:CHAT domain-containing protein